MKRIVHLGALLVAGLVCIPVRGLDLSRAVVRGPVNPSTVEKKAVETLLEEVEKRTQLRLATGGAGAAVIELRRGGGPADGYTLAVETGRVVVSGNDARGVLFGAGRLLREARMERQVFTIADGLRITAAPKYPLRGHQLGYRPKTNAYDAWDTRMWEQYIRELAIYGTNAIELIPPRSDDDADSPHFPLPPMEMMVEMSRIADQYGLDVWVWYPALDKDYENPAAVEAAVKEWGAVFARLPRIDAVFVPGGDPGHTEPKYMFRLLERETAELHRHHPKAQMWMSPQGFNKAWMDQFYSLMDARPKWLSGIVFAPQVPVSLPELRKRLPREYPIRHYPDITHTRSCQYPVPDWDVALAMTEAREVINPRPVDEANIFRLMQPYTMGFITYSEGCNDDVNKFLWSMMGWDPDRDLADMLRDFAQFFIGPKTADGFAQGLLALERGWRGPLLTNGGVETTLDQFRAMEREATPQQKENWRFLQGLYRAYYDAYVRRRLVYETDLENQAMDALRLAPGTGSRLAIDRADAILNRALTYPVAPDLRARVYELAEGLFQTIHMQLSVPRYQAIDVGRGASLDTIDVPLNDRGWLQQRFERLRTVDEGARAQGIDEILNWANPGPGGFYDDLGDTRRQPHLVPGEGWERDPAFWKTPLVGFAYRPEWRKSWRDDAESLHDEPLRMRYTGLDGNARYKIRVVYAGDMMGRSKIRMVAGGIEVHPLMAKPRPVAPLEFDIPAGAVQGGRLEISWYREKGAGGNGRGCQVSEVWLIRK
ncbi:MAG: hypothetical protein IT160_02040 [Bryobacterales bacterium]|nr:hypothetical protein [Bryobacterales bacterium]